MVTIIFEAHSTTTDNEEHLSSGWNDVPLSDLGREQSKELGLRYKGADFDAVFTSDMERAYQTAKLAFSNIDPRKLQLDWRLRECDYGDLTQHPKAEVDVLKPQHVSTPFPGGESYEHTASRVRSFLEDLNRFHGGQKVMLIGHRATQYGLEHWINGATLHDAVTAPWKWQPGWTYKLREIAQ